VLGIQASLILRHDHGLPNPLLCLPLDDDIFEHGLRRVLEERIPNLDLPWEERRDAVFWRGAGPHPLRQKVVEQLFGDEHANVLYGRIPGNREEDWSQKWWDKTYQGRWQPIELEEFVKYKYILIIDNCIITSSYTWVFGSGSVPILVSHPLNDFWFKEFLVPYMNYVPVVHPDFGEPDVAQTVRFLREHDDVARRIAENARALSEKIFTPGFQREYIRSRLEPYARS
jgi:hypothetical protein